MNKSPRIPNLYLLLGLSPLESDRQSITAALKKIAAKLKAAKDSGQTAQADEQARLQKLLTLGQQVLLDPSKKEQYDAQWQTVYGQARMAVAQPSKNQWSMGTLETLLPEGDPHAPFDMAEYLRSSQVRDPAIAEADLNKLITLLGGEPLPSSNVAPAPQSMTITSEHLASPDAFPQPTLSSIAVDTPVDRVDLRPSAGSQQAVATLVGRMRKRQQRSLILGGLGLVAGALVLAGMFVYLNRPKSDQTELAQNPPKPAAPVKPDVPKPNDTPVPAENGTSLPSPATNSQPTANTPRENKPTATTDTGLLQPGQLNKPLQIQATPSNTPEMNTGAAPAPEPAKPAEPPKPAEPDKPAETPTSTEPATPAMADQPLADQDKRQWLKNMKAVTSALGKLDIAAADKQLEEIKSSIKTEVQRQQHQRLVAVSGLVAKARELISTAIVGLEPGQELSIKSNKVAFIEGGPDYLVIFQSKAQRRFKLGELPAAVAEVLIDQNSLDSKGLAAKGAYLMLHPKNAMVAATAKRALEDAVHAGAITPEVARFYEDDYELK